ncbi:hypothetical protein CUJ91_32050 (plasmid) [Paraburkholderia graminis]|uniref:hypothetical protein n=1 Tax=Paraburkholderia graminis TaxID=60548 RepID=UPI000DEEF397|nr:hypothetical protein [Paraburkholderia graminis]AXF12636.1 hypothetical protein CUJ91_32050 [Paraburkholderia graminis]
MKYAAALVALFAWLGVTFGAPLGTSSSSRATAFVVAVATSDLRSARQGGQHVFAYTPEETEATLSSAITEWLTEGDKRSLRLALADRQTIFAFHWAAMQMPAESQCFADIDSDGCQKDLDYWLTRVRNSDSQFISAYRQSQMRLGLPPLITHNGGGL